MQPGLPPNKKAKVDPAEAKAMPKVKAEPKASPKPSPKLSPRQRARQRLMQRERQKERPRPRPSLMQPSQKARPKLLPREKERQKQRLLLHLMMVLEELLKLMGLLALALQLQYLLHLSGGTGARRTNSIRSDSLDKDIQSHFLGLKQGGPGKRGELTEFLNSIIKRTADGKLQVDVDYAVKTRMVRNMGHEVKSRTKAYIKAQALAKVGGEAALNEALRVGDIKMGMMNGQMFYLFPTATFEAWAWMWAAQGRTSLISNCSKR